MVETQLTDFICCFLRKFPGFESYQGQQMVLRQQNSAVCKRPATARRCMGRKKRARPSILRRSRDSLLAARHVIVLAALFAVICLSAANASPDDRTPFVSLYASPKPFLSAIAAERRSPPAGLRVTGISVPHHLLAADLIARGFQAASGGQYDRVIIVSPDHFSRSRRPMATTRRDIDTVFGPVHNDREATDALLQMDELFDDSDLFAKEHGIAALLPFIRHFFPNAKIVPIAISYSATREECDRALALLEKQIGTRTLIVQSTDYSHYLSSDVARQRDQETLNIIAANDAEDVFRLVQPDHMDSRASQYVQMKLQSGVYKSHATVIANRNSAEYSAMGRRTTSYIVTVYTERLSTGAELRYPDQEVMYFGGDSFVGRWLTAPLADKAVAAAVIREIRSITGGAPMVINLEGVLMDEPPEGVGNDLHVMHASLAIPILKALNVKVAGLANNHSFDLGPLGYQESRAILQKADIVPLGHQEIVDVGPFRLLGLNFIGKFDYQGYPVVKDNDLDAICGMKARPPLLAFVHWGEEYTDVTGPLQYAAAQAMQACGIAAIVGAHPHRAANSIEAMQGGEYELVYSLGNLLFDQTADRGSGALLELRMFKQGTYAARLIPIANLFDMSVEQLKGRQRQPVGTKTDSEHNKAD
jgi:AmmeMemoRadiSam system protein B